ncbi:TetR/AcrR family transcriptional regulator [Nocardia sp. NPDC005998]|uniref:TetR/AcrR family transcriptional regulator n=1 Tax=Nocardia sp. NPDC005998 TaxID=3156894 RepID=UPI0033BE4292
MTAEPAAPAVERRTRPRNRRQLIIAAAAQLFYRDGFDHVGMGDIAEAVGIGPSALYRHFSGKQDLLTAVIDAGFQPVAALIDEIDLRDSSTTLQRLGELALDERYVGVLWRRESRYLPPDARARQRGDLFRMSAQLADKVRCARTDLGTDAADLLAWSLLAVLASPSFHRLELPRADYVRLLAELAATVLDTTVPTGFSAGDRYTGSSNLLPFSRREALLTEAVRMFATYGYAEVGIEDIGKAVGVTGPSIYNHFSSKLDMLTTAFDRGGAALLLDLSPVFSDATDAGDALGRLIGDYISFCRAHHHLIGLLVTEVDHLPAEHRQRARQVQHDYVSEWVHLLRSVVPELDAPTARIRVHAALAVINDAARMPHLRTSADLGPVLNSLSLRLLSVER